MRIFDYRHIYNVEPFEKTFRIKIVNKLLITYITYYIWGVST